MRIHYRIRNSIFGFGLAAAVFFVSVWAQSVDAESEGEYTNRYLQHKKAAEAASWSYVEGELNTHLPLVRIDTGGVEIPGTPILNDEGLTVGYELAVDGSTTIPAQVDIFDEEGVYHQPSGEPDQELSAQIRVRGNTSRLFDKKSYKLEFYDDNGLELSANVMGMGEHKEWALYGPFLDKTLLRNYLFLNLCGEREPYTADVRFCEVILNGEYQGLYVMMELVSRGESRVDLSPSSTRSDKTSYILRVDRMWDDPSELDTFSFYTNNLEPGSRISVIYPGTPTLTDMFQTFIEADFNAFEKSLYSYDFKDPEKGYRAYIDVQSFVDHYIIAEFLLINDICSRSTYFYKDLGGKLHMGPCWDFNNTADNFINPVSGADGTGFNYTQRSWFRMLLKDEYFVEQVIETYREMRDGGILDEDRLMEEIDGIIDYLGDAVDRNFQVWGYSFDPTQLNNHNKLRPVERNPQSYEEAISDLKEFLQVRGEWLDENIEMLRQYCHVSMIKQYLD